MVQSVDDILVEFGHTGKDNMGVILNNEIVKNLTEVESTIYHAILAEPKFVEELALQLNLTLAEVSSIVGMLEVKGLVRKDEVGRIRII